MIRRILGLLVLIAIGNAVVCGEDAGPLHPVAISEKEAENPEFCLGCHDNIKGKFTHSAITSVGCTGCHEITREKDDTFITVRKGPQLCLQCHPDKGPPEAKGLIHPPVLKDCTTCHSPHSSENKDQLLMPLSGDSKSNLCLKCHNLRQDAGEKGSWHAAVDMGCDTCHITHKTGDLTRKEFRYHLAKAPPSLCLDCHDVKEPKLASAHHDQPVAQADCAGCHNPHASPLPKLVQKNVHPPFADGGCDTCHQAPKDGKVVLNEDGKRALCFMCHDNIQKQVESAKVQHAALQIGECTECHNPHATREAWLLKQRQGDVCAGCHERSVLPVQHGPYEKGQCSLCHMPHGGDHANLLVAEGNNLCLGCHKLDAPGLSIDAATKMVTLPWKRTMREEDYAGIVKIGLGRTDDRGHPVMGHPVRGTFRLAADPKTQITVSCLSCHQPHSSQAPNLMPKGVKDDVALCANCHK